MKSNIYLIVIISGATQNNIIIDSLNYFIAYILKLRIIYFKKVKSFGVYINAYNLFRLCIDHYFCC